MLVIDVEVCVYIYVWCQLRKIPQNHDGDSSKYHNNAIYYYFQVIVNSWRDEILEHVSGLDSPSTTKLWITVALRREGPYRTPYLLPRWCNSAIFITLQFKVLRVSCFCGWPVWSYPFLFLHCRCELTSIGDYCTCWFWFLTLATYELRNVSVDVVINVLGTPSSRLRQYALYSSPVPCCWTNSLP